MAQISSDLPVNRRDTPLIPELSVSGAFSGNTDHSIILQDREVSSKNMSPVFAQASYDILFVYSDLQWVVCTT
jgi:hypothetical protein